MKRQMNSELMCRNRTIKVFHGVCRVDGCDKPLFRWKQCRYHYDKNQRYKRSERAKFVRQPKHKTIHAVRVFSDGARTFFASTFVFEDGSVDITFRLGS